VLVVLQGMDTSGKGGAVKKVAGLVNPAGARVTGFGPPTEAGARAGLPLAHREALPPPGVIGFFDRSHYEDVLIVRVHDLVPPAEWETRYDRINAWEAGLAEQGVVLLKVMLHISPQEQRERLLARLDDPSKHWKVNPGDIASGRTGTPYATAYEAAADPLLDGRRRPWHVLPADRKWYRNWGLAHLLLETLEELDPQWPAPELDLDGMRAALRG
jgi:polyphosphate kinase 2 (PPK2 family)